MSNAVSTSVSGLLAFKRAIDVHSQNVANVNTPGYVRRTVELETRSGTGAAGQVVGSGVEVARVRRLVNEYLIDQSRTARSAAGRAEVLSEKSAQVNSLLSPDASSLQDAMVSLRDAFDALASQPTSSFARDTVMSRLDTTISQFKELDARLAAYDQEVSGRVAGEVDSINGLVEQVAKLNRQISASYSRDSGGNPSLLDARDRILDELSGKISLRITQGDNGTVSLSMMNGQSLLNGVETYSLVAVRDPYEVDRLKVGLKSGSGVQDLDNQFGGGTLAGLLDTRSQLIDPTRNELGRVAAGLASMLNSQNALGSTLSGVAGGNLLNVGAPVVKANPNNSGSATVTASIANPLLLTGQDYLIESNGAGWTVLRASTMEFVATTGAGTSGDPLSFDGVSLVVAGSASSGDRYLVRPTVEAVSGLTVAVTNSRDIAAAKAGSVAGSGDNTNALALAAAFDKVAFDGAQRSVRGILERLAGRVASAADSSRLSFEVQTLSAEEAQSDRDNMSAVNLDEEAAELLRYQQAYQAAAQVMRTSNELFDTLLGAVR
jgi:flagellar hook-associated protein 1 FlgK